MASYLQLYTGLHIPFPAGFAIYANRDCFALILLKGLELLGSRHGHLALGRREILGTWPALPQTSVYLALKHCGLYNRENNFFFFFT